MRQFKKLLVSAALLLGSHGFVLGAEPLYPDLISWAKPGAYMYDAEIVTVNGRKRLRFSSAPTNKGRGPFELRGQVEDDGTTTAHQRVYYDDGSFTDHSAGVFVFQGHADHNHFHFAGFAAYYLKRVTAAGGVGSTVAASEKVGFAMWDIAKYDLTLPGAPQSPVYQRPVGTDVEREGISVGWADVYEKNLEDQDIDITGVADGDYWLENVMDPDSRILETDETNNATRLRIRIEGDQVTFPPDEPPNPAPVLTELVPSSTTVGTQGKTIELHGSGFINGSVVRWNGSARPTVFVNSSLLRASFSASDLDSETNADITVFNLSPGGGISAVKEFTVYEPPQPPNPVPVLTEISPSSAAVGTASRTIELRGNNFMDSSVVRWDGSARATVFVGSTLLRATLRASDVDSEAAADITVFNPSPGGGISEAREFIVYQPPVPANPVPILAELAPSSITVGTQGKTIEIRGSNFIDGSIVRLNGQARPTTFDDASHLFVFFSAEDLDSAGTSSVTVFNPAPGGGNSLAKELLIYTPPPDPNPVPSLDEISPTSATAGNAGRLIELRGSNFIQNSVALWNGSPRTTTFISGSLLRVFITAQDFASDSTAILAVRNPAPGGGDSDSETFIVYTPPPAPNPAPVLFEVTPSSSTAGGPGAVLEVQGFQFIPASRVSYNGEVRTTVFVNSSLLRVTLTAQDMASPSTAAISVFTPEPGGGTSANKPFIVYIPPPAPNPVPVLSSVSPSSAPAGSSDLTLELGGSNFTSGSIVRYDGESRPTVFVNSTVLRATLSFHDLGSTGGSVITVFNPEPGGGSSAAKPFVVYTPPPSPNSAPEITELSPSSAAIGTQGMTIEVSGERFIPGSVVRWNGEPRFTTFANVSILYVYLTPQDLNAEQTGSITVFTPTPGGGTSAAKAFAVYRLPDSPPPLPPPPPSPPPPDTDPVNPADVSDLNNARVFPNPWRVDQHRGRNVIIDRLTDQSTVFLFTISGKAIRTLRASAGSVEWDLMNDSGEAVGSGLYFYLITDDEGRRRTGTLALIR